jgi:hypothetical protein
MFQLTDELQSLGQKLEAQGYVLLRQALSADLIQQLLTGLSHGHERDPADIKSRQGATYASRNVLDWLPLSRTVWQTPAVLRFLGTAFCNSDFGLVRGLFFDKHPERTWSLGWHKDMTIAVQDNSLPSQHFCKPTLKAGVPHVEASADVLRNMLTLRIHLDQVTNDNGPLEVIPRSHFSGKQTVASFESKCTILAEAGDVLAMRPLISHASGSSAPGTRLHRRILHLEFAAHQQLPDGYQWFHFIRPTRISTERASDVCDPD